MTRLVTADCRTVTPRQFFDALFPPTPQWERDAEEALKRAMAGSDHALAGRLMREAILHQAAKLRGDPICDKCGSLDFIEGRCERCAEGEGV